MQAQIDRRNPDIIFTGSQFGYYSRIDLKNDKRTFIRPKHELGEKPYRFNWESPILLSPHNQDILYFGTNKLIRSMDQGDTWQAISPDLTSGGKEGNVPFGTLTCISESPFQFGLLYTGSDDGIAQVSKDGGSRWQIISGSLKKDLWVSSLVASQHKKERVYLALSGYRWDDFTTYLYESNDYGKTWKSISANIPNSPVNVIIEDPENENLLFVGTDNGLYASFDQGTSWEAFQDGMPSIAIHDLVIQPEAKHLLVGTHGRSIYKADISNVQKMTPEVLQKDLHIYPLENIKFSERWGNAWNSWSKASTPGLDITFYSNRDEVYQAKIKSYDDILVSETDIVSDKGINILSYDLAFSKIGKLNYLKKHKTELKTADDGKTYLPKGSYSVELKGNGKTELVTFEIE